MSLAARREALDRIRDGDRLDLVADDEERLAIAERLGLVALDRLEAHVVLHRDVERVRATGRVKAALVQACVASGEPVVGHIDEPFDLLFVPDPGSAVPDDEIELGAEDCDTLFHDGAAIDLGQAIVDTLALSLDPYPRSAGAEAALREAGVLSAEQAGPFAALARLNKRSDEE